MKPQPQDSIAHWTQTMQAQMDQQRDQLRARDPGQIARNSGARWQGVGPDDGQITISFFQMPLVVDVPAYDVLSRDGESLPTIIESLVIAYLLRANGAPRAGKWIAFRELPDGLMYHQAFTGYTGELLARELGNDLAAFQQGARAAGGRELTGFGDAAYEFQALPGIWLAAVYWLGDEEDDFPPQASILFDRAASHYLVTDGLAIVGSQLVRRIVRAARS